MGLIPGSVGESALGVTDPSAPLSQAFLCPTLLLFNHPSPSCPPPPPLLPTWPLPLPSLLLSNPPYTPPTPPSAPVQSPTPSVHVRLPLCSSFGSCNFSSPSPTHPVTFCIPVWLLSPPPDCLGACSRSIESMRETVSLLSVPVLGTTVCVNSAL